MDQLISETALEKTYTEEELRSLAKSLIRLFELWQLDDSEALSLLGVPDTGLSILISYRNGAPLDYNQATLVRVGHLLAIHRNLNLLFRHNPDLSYRWMKTPNLAFGGLMPVQAIRTGGGLDGLLMVRAYLEHSQNY